jgi:deoxyxylulose-5-phosphate synthase
MDEPPASYPLLETIASPADLRKLPAAKLTDLAQELRCIMCSTPPTIGLFGM